MDEKSTLKRLKSMSFNEKISYIWYYYKIHIFSFIALFLTIIFFVYSQSSKQEIYYNITYVGSTLDADELSHLNDTLNKKVLNGDSKKIINIEPVFMDDSTNNTNSQYVQKLTVQFAAKEIDMAIVNKQFFETNYSSDMFLNLETLEGFSSLGIPNKNVIQKEDSNGNTGTYGINAKYLNLLKNIHFSSDDYYLVAISNSQRTEKIIDIIKAFSES